MKKINYIIILIMLTIYSVTFVSALSGDKILLTAYYSGDVGTDMNDTQLGQYNTTKASNVKTNDTIFLLGDGAIDFDGSDDTIRMNNFNWNLFQETNQTTINFWFYARKTDTQRIFSDLTDALESLGISDPAGGYNFKAGAAQGWTAPLPYAFNWTMFTGVKNGTNCSVYLNGTLRQSYACDAGHLNRQLRFGVDWDVNLDFDGIIDEISIWNISLQGQNVTQLYNSGAGFNPLAVLPGAQEFVVNITLPKNNTINNTNIFNFTYNVSSGTDIKNCSLYHNATGTWHLNNTNETPIVNGSLFNNNFTNINISETSFVWNAECCNATECFFSSYNFTLTTDFTDPVISGKPDLENNNTIVHNGSLSTYINFSDEREIYSINVTWGNLTQLFGVLNLGDDNYELNISNTVSTTTSDNLTARVCDSHTAKKIKDIETKENNKGIKYVMKKQFIFFDKEWVHIYPKYNPNYNAPSTTKKIDKYSFSFNKGTTPGIETFVIESSHYIDIPKGQTYSGHLVIRDIGDNGYWVDFENDEATSYNIKRISATKIEVIVYGLKSKNIEFNSIGELNCVTKTFYYGNLNPTETFKNPTIAGSSDNFGLNVTEDPVTVRSINVSLFYNGSAVLNSTTANFSKTLTAPQIASGNSTKILFYWQVNVNNASTFNLTVRNQTVSDFILDNCTAVNTTALNYTFRDEENQSIININVDGVYNYTFGGVTKQYTLDLDDVGNYSICIFPNTTTFTTNYDLTYSSAIYPQRSFSERSLTINNISQQRTLYALEASEGIFARFQIVNSFGSPIPAATGVMSRTIGGVSSTIEKELSDDSGLMTFFVNPDVTYNFVFSKTGSGSQTLNLRVTTTEIITITLGSTATEQVLPFATGIIYKFSPENIILNNNTNQKFIFNLSTSFWNLTSCAFEIRNDTGLMNQISGFSNRTQCDIDLTINTGNITNISVTATYVLNGTQRINVSRFYIMSPQYVGEASLKVFFNDLKAFNNAGFDNSTRMILAFLVILSIVGLAARSTPMLREPTAFITLSALLVIFFSILGFFTLSNIASIPDIPILGRAWLQQYIISILYSIMVGSYIIKKEILS